MLENLGEQLSRRASLAASEVAVFEADTGRRATWGQLDERASRFSRVLQRVGLGAGDRLAVLLKNGIVLFESYAAAARAGVVFCSLNWRLSVDELLALLRDSGATALLFDADFDELAEALFARSDECDVRHWIRTGTAPSEFSASYEELLTSASPSDPDVRIDAGDDLLLLFTSGTTGRAKGVVHTHANAFWAAADWIFTSDFRAGDRYLVFLPPFHIGSFNPFGVALLRGMCIVTLRDFDPELAWRVVAREGITAFAAVPTMLADMQRARGGLRLDALRWVISGGAAADPELTRRYQTQGIRLLQGWGMTETFAEGTVLAPRDAVEHPESIGRPWYLTRLAVVAPDGREVRRGEVGELVVRCPAMMRGYWGMADATAEALRQGALHTGDLARIDEKGLYFICGRLKDLIISGGENIMPGEIEQVIRTHPGVADVSVIGQPSLRWGESPLALVVRADPALSAEDVLRHCSSGLARFKRVRSVEFVDELPRNALGKIDKEQLRRRYPGPAPE
jgi:acyl-CoA synthetase (AMP-forming)/AMP-acid ligase II